MPQLKAVYLVDMQTNIVCSSTEWFQLLVCKQRHAHLCSTLVLSVLCMKGMHSYCTLEIIAGGNALVAVSFEVATSPCLTRSEEAP